MYLVPPRNLGGNKQEEKQTEVPYQHSTRVSLAYEQMKVSQWLPHPKYAILW